MTLSEHSVRTHFSSKGTSGDCPYSCRDGELVQNSVLPPNTRTRHLLIVANSSLGARGNQWRKRGRAIAQAEHRCKLPLNVHTTTLIVSRNDTMLTARSRPRIGRFGLPIQPRPSSLSC